MSESKRSNDPGLSRRDLLRSAAMTTSAAWVASAACAQDSTRPSDRGLVRGIDPKNVVDQYAARELDRISDAELYRQVTEIVSVPLKRSSSFVIHAPLEAMARYGLLPLVEPKNRARARQQMVASAATYGNGETVPAPSKWGAPFPSLQIASNEVAQALKSRDPEALESIVLQVADQFGTSSLVQVLTPLALPSKTGAAHSHIGLWLLLRHGGAAGSGDAALLRAAVRSLARSPNSRLSSFSEMSIQGGAALNQTSRQIEREIQEKLSQPPKIFPPNRSIATQLAATEKSGHVDELFGDLIRHDLSGQQIDSAFRAVLRIAAHSMLQDDLSQAKFGWSHTLTMPQAACGLSSFNINRKLALASTLVWATSRRCISGSVPLDVKWKPEQLSENITLAEALRTSPQVAAARVWYADPAERSQILQALATEASIRKDQHLVKYVRACLDMTTFDPSYETLYLAAAAHLCGIWIRERPENRIRI